MKSNDLSLYTVITTGIIIPGWFAVLSLNSFTNCIILTPLEPKAGPTGGAGDAFPASICNLIKFDISFSAILMAPPLSFWPLYYFIFWTCENSNSTGVSLPNIDTRTFTLCFSVLISWTVPTNPSNGPCSLTS